MNQLYLIVAVLPIFLIGLYVYQKDKEKEPISFLLKLLVMGCISGVNVIFVEILFYLFGYEVDVNSLNTYELIMYSFFHIALIEEGIKLIYLYYYSYNSKYYDYTFDMIVYGAFVSLGFALLENILYVYQYGISTGLQRAVTAIVLHACCGILMGNLLGKSKIFDLEKEKSKKYLYIFLAFLVPFCIHGMYDFCALSGKLYNLIVIVIIMLTTCITVINYNREKDRKLLSDIN